MRLSVAKYRPDIRNVTRMECNVVNKIESRMKEEKKSNEIIHQIGYTKTRLILNSQQRYSDSL